jgi:hypothetical protein
LEEKSMKKKHILLWMLIVSMLIMTACSSPQPKEENGPGTKPPSGVPAAQEPKDEESIVKGLAAQAIKAIKDYDLEALSKMVHPEKGLRFTPYAFVDEKQDRVFTAQEIKQAGSSDKKYTWGSYDGTGEPIKGTFGEYYKKFVYDADFAHAKEIGYNQTLGKGNSLNNSKEFYKDSYIVEYYFPQIDPQYQGLDWRSLRLVFEKSGDDWYLTGIIHDQWTV